MTHIELANILHAARERVCELGNNDHGHTDCWIIGGLLNEIDRLNEVINNQAAEVRRLDRENQAYEQSASKWRI